MANTTLVGHSNSSFEMENNIIVDQENFQKEKVNNVEFDQSETKLQYLKRIYPTILKYFLHIVFLGYFSYATYYYINKQSICINDCYIRFCTGYGMLVILYVLTYLGLTYHLLFKPRIGSNLYQIYVKPFNKWWMYTSRTKIASILTIIVVLILLVIFLYFETHDNPQKLRGLICPVFFILMGYIFSTNRKAINWRIVLTGIAYQFLLCVFCVRWEPGRRIFQCMGDKMATFLNYTLEGATFVYGKLLVENNVFAFSVMPVIFFVSFFVSILHYLGVMQWIVMQLGWILSLIMNTTICESLISGSNIFLGMSESPLLIRPYMKLLTNSEIHAIMVSGFATVSGSVLAAYLSFGASAADLITSSVMAAPAALAFAKLYFPETEQSQTSTKNIKLVDSEDNSILDAATSGTTVGINIVLGICANIVAFVSFMAFINGIVSWMAMLVGFEYVTFEYLFAKLFIPIAWAMGVRNADCEIVAKLIATKSILNEFVAYERLGTYISSGALSEKSISIATYAICGFANPSSIGILIGTLSSLAPSRRQDISSVAIRAFCVGSIVCFVSASFAGILSHNLVDEMKNTLTNLEINNITLVN